MPLSPSLGDDPVLEWHKSSHSTDDGPACVEVAAASGAVLLRDSKNPQGPRLAFRSGAWAGFVRFAAEG
ncbi:DUF397 domain-containing protein [Streptomyces xinghaiensis]|uniref:DUF397 domain-containing protein n=1 Tax=Streptomyces xinghaiensis TaxID=1038928 RepID=UPI002E13F3EC|nr:DUF397 domain-containing protein [Streptomyces xinghaiensis]